MAWTNAAIVVFLVLNRHLPGMLLAGLGLAMNVVVIFTNGAMPVSLVAADIAGVETSLTEGIGHEPMTSGTVLPWLGDVIPLPGLGVVISAGDVVLAAGLATLAYRRAFATEGTTAGEGASAASD
jgi:hypothetical protein